MKSATSPTPTGQHHTPRLDERTDTSPQLPQPLDQSPAPTATTTSRAADPHHLRALADNVARKRPHA